MYFLLLSLVLEPVMCSCVLDEFSAGGESCRTRSSSTTFLRLFMVLINTFRAMRRRHGIPDNDARPFNVAYAAAERARKTREQGVKRLSAGDALGDNPNLRQRLVDTGEY